MLGVEVKLLVKVQLISKLVFNVVRFCPIFMNNKYSGVSVKNTGSFSLMVEFFPALSQIVYYS